MRILRPGNPIPADVKPFANKHPEMTDKVCALVEYERTEFAHKAVKDLNKEGEEGMKVIAIKVHDVDATRYFNGLSFIKVMELTAPPPKKTKPSSDDKKKASLASAVPVKPQFQPQRRFSHAGFGMQGQVSGGNQEGAKRKISLFHNMKFNPILEEQDNQAAQRKESGLNPNAPTFNMQQYQPQQRYPPFSINHPHI